MKIVKLTAENFKRLKAVEIEPTGNIVTVSGANEQGKSSVLDAIWAAIGLVSMEKATGTVRSLRNGEKKGFVTVDLGDLIVTRKWSDTGTSSVTVENKDGARYGSPQKILDGLIGKIAIDPLSFASMPEKEQREMMLKMVAIDYDFENSANFRRGAYERRTELNKNIKYLESQLSTHPEVPAGTPDQEISQSAIIDEMAAAQKAIDDNRELREAVTEIQTEISEHSGEIQTTELKIADAEMQVQRLKNDLEFQKAFHGDLVNRAIAVNTTAAALVDPDLTVFKTKLESVSVINKNVTNKIAIAKIVAEIEGLRGQVLAQESKMAAIDNEKSAALAAAKFPIEHLSISDDGVLYKDVPFSQCSSAERLRVSISIAMAMNPKLRVIRIIDGSLIDSKNMAVIEEMAAEKDWQIWIETVREEIIDKDGNKTYPAGIYIEDGEVKAIDGEVN